MEGRMKVTVINEDKKEMTLNLDELRDWINKKIDLIKELQKDLEKQSTISKKFGEELQYFQKQKQNVLYEKKLKKYRDEIIQLKRNNHP